MDWNAAGAHEMSIEELKEELPLEWVIGEAAGIPLEHNGTGRAVGLCPFHDDDTPSLDLYGHGTRWGCFPCGRGGDLFDFIGEFWSIDGFTARFEKAIDLYLGFKNEADWTGSIEAAGLAEVVTDEEVYDEYLSAFKNFELVAYPIAQLLQNKGGLLSEIPPFWLHSHFHLGVTHQYEVMAPHFNVDGALVSYKTRWAGKGGWYARSGRKLTELYGVQHLQGADNGELPVWICEGETDTWLAAYLLRGRGVALGLPRGAMSHIEPHWIEQLTNRRVTLVFDDDTAGRSAARRWHKALVGVAAEVLVSFPDGDLCDTFNPLKTLTTGEPVNTPAQFIAHRGDEQAYMQVGRNGVGDQLSNWILVPRKFISYTDVNGMEVRRGFEGHFTNDRSAKRIIFDTDLKDQKSVINWANLQGRVWFGAGGKWVQSILDELNAEAVFLPRVDAVGLVGLHGVERGRPVFVMPEDVGGVIGSAGDAEKWRYHEPPTAVANYGAHYVLSNDGRGVGGGAVDDGWEIEAINAMLAMNRADVMTPLLGWLAVAPLRSLTREFPTIAFFGGSGAGKTSMLQSVLWAWYGLDEEHNLGQMQTPFATVVWGTGTNMLPVWFDEYRNLSRSDTMNAVQQMIRDAWTASSSSRGGIGEDKARVRELKITAPLIISGESAFQDRSLIDRALSINMPHRGKGAPDTELKELRRITGTKRGVFGRRYLEWLVRGLALGTVPPPPEDLDRQRRGEAVVEWGWRILGLYLRDVTGGEIEGWQGRLDLSNIRRDRAQSDEHPVLSALTEALENGSKDNYHDDIPVAWIETAGKTELGRQMAGVIEGVDSGDKSVVAVRGRQFFRWATGSGYQFPGGEKATINWLLERFNGVKGRPYYSGVWGQGKQVTGIYLYGVLEAIEKETQGGSDE